MLSVPAGVSSGQKMRLKGMYKKATGRAGFFMRKFKLRFRRHSRPMSVGSWKSGRISQRSILGVIRECRYPPDRCDQYTGGAGSGAELRVRVFVDEQRVPPEEEVDHYDALPEERVGALHVLSCRSGEALGTGRLIYAKKPNETAKIGRVAVSESARGLGLAER